MAQTIEFNITGMTCDHCVHAVTTAVKDLQGVTDVRLASMRSALPSPVTASTLRRSLPPSKRKATRLP
jgi:copper chaperone CopZ